MVILPAIDIKDGKCVRLVQGKYDSAYTVAESAADTAKAFEAMGATWLHMVDLDGAKAVSYTHLDVYKRQEQARFFRMDSWISRKSVKIG